MVAYSFQRPFVAPIQAGTKAQTIRSNRKRHARPGEAVQLYAGMRTRQCERIIPDVRCRDVVDVLLDFDAWRWIVKVGPTPLLPTALEQFAIQDGFENMAAMVRFWRESHGPEPFRGVLITWDPSP